MKRILIWMPSLELGGAERSLIGLLQSIDYSRMQVDLFLNRQEGELLRFLPPEVHLLPEVEAYRCLAEPIVSTVKRGHLLLAGLRCYSKCRSKLKKGNARNAGISGEYLYKYTRVALPRIMDDVEYDLAISFVFPHYFVPEKVKAKKTVAWIHTDYTKIKIDVASQLKMWGKFDKIVSISESVTESFLTVFPSLREKITLIENILPSEMVYAQMAEFDPKAEMPENPGEVRLLSIGRFCEAKNFDNVPEICRLLLDNGCNVKWYLIGYGSAKSIEKSIVKFSVENHVIILGKKGNPYPYIRRCDLYVQPSRYEGKAVTVREAQMIGKPVLITAFPTASAQLEDGVDGAIVPLDCKGCADAIAAYLHDAGKLRQFAENCKSRDYSNSGEVEKVYALL